MSILEAVLMPRTSLLLRVAPITALCCLGALSGCSAGKLDIPQQVFRGQSLCLQDWMVLGPFDAPEGVAGLETAIVPNERNEALPPEDFLKFTGSIETSANDGFPMPSGKPRRAWVRGVETFLFSVALQQSIFRDGSVFYAACYIQCSEAQTVHAMLGLMGTAKVFLNGVLVGQATAWIQRPYEHSLPLALKRGKNLLVVKLAKLRGAGECLGMRIEPSVESAIARALECNGLFLKNNIPLESEPIEVSIPGAPHGGRLEVTVVGSSGKIVAKTSFGNGGGLSSPAIDATNPNIKPGIYRARAAYAGKEYEEEFCLGDPVAVFEEFERRAAPYLGDEAIRINAGGLQRRMQILFRSENRKPADAEWRRRVVYALAEYENIVLALERGSEALRGIPGLHLRGFESRIDGATQYYRLYVPTTYQTDAGDWPVIVMVPPPIAAPVPFIQGPFLARQFVAEDFARIAERQKVILVWAGYRSATNHSPAELAHLDEVINALARDYRIDRHKISLTGTCAAGVMALMAVVQWPERFSAVGILHPLFHRSRNRRIDQGLFDDIPEYQTWLQRADPAKQWAALNGTPLWILHNDTFPGHGSLADSEEFASAARSHGLHPRFDRMSRGDPQELDGFERLFNWLAAQRRESASSKPGDGMFAGHPSFGPICRAFMERFVVVEGTGGTEADHTHMRRLSREFKEAWRRVHFGDCRVKTDIALTDEEIDASNLVLLGNAETNVVWKKLGGNFPLNLEQEGMRLFDKQWVGHGLGIQAVFPHPRNSERLVVVIGGADLPSAEFGTMEVSVDGWYDFAVWGHKELVAAGHYGSSRNSSASP